MDNHRKEIEQLLLSCLINQDNCNELDKMEYQDYKLPYELFKATRTNKLVSKAIFILQKDKKPISDITVLKFIQDKTQINEMEMLELLSKLWCTYETFKSYMAMLKEIDREERRKNILEEL